MEIGTDIVEIKRIEQAYVKHSQFVKRILTPKELLLFERLQGSRRFSFLAGRFSAKEAYSKAVGCGIGRLKFTDIEILSGSQGKPYLSSGPLIESVKVSISHSQDFAIAMVIIDLDFFMIEKKLQQFLSSK